ncbi:MAG: hypothetical protein RL417_2018, partial [Pseudomonadota bacterium]
ILMPDVPDDSAHTVSYLSFIPGHPIGITIIGAPTFNTTESVGPVFMNTVPSYRTEPSNPYAPRQPTPIAGPMNERYVRSERGKDGAL